MAPEYIVLLCMSMVHHTWTMVRNDGQRDALAFEIEHANHERWLIVKNRRGDVLAIINKKQLPKDGQCEALHMQAASEIYQQRQQRKEAALARLAKAAEEMSPRCFVYCGPAADDAWSDDDEEPTGADRCAMCCAPQRMSIND